MKQEAFKLFAPEIKAFQEGKQIQIFIRNKWVDTDNPSFDVKSKYRVKPEEPKLTKRLPTIEEVEKWFMENRVFIYKKTNVLQRIFCIDRNNKNNKPLNDGDEWQTIEDFCDNYTHIDGSELYITENEKPKLTYGGEIADFPIEVVERMLECQVEQGNKRDVSVFERNKIAGSYSKGFCWVETKEDVNFWNEVIGNKNFDLFFQKYHKKSNQ